MVSRKDLFTCWSFIFALFIVLLTICLFFIFEAKATERRDTFTEMNVIYEFGVERGHTGGKLCISRGKYLSDWSSIRMEGSIGKLWFADSSGLQMGLSVLLKFDPKIYNTLRFYGEAGTGIGYANGNKQRVFYPGPVGLVDGGLGIIFPLTEKSNVVIGWRFSHISSLRPGDRGLNLHGVNIGLTF